LGKASICCDWVKSDGECDRDVIIWKAFSPGTPFSPGDTSNVEEGDLGR